MSNARIYGEPLEETMVSTARVRELEAENKELVTAVSYLIISGDRAKHGRIVDDGYDWEVVKDAARAVLSRHYGTEYKSQLEPNGEPPPESTQPPRQGTNPNVDAVPAQAWIDHLQQFAEQPIGETESAPTLRQDESGCEWRLWTGTRCGLQRSSSLHSGIKYCQGHNDLVLEKLVGDELRAKNKKLKKQNRYFRKVLADIDKADIERQENEPHERCQCQELRENITAVADELDVWLRQAEASGIFEMVTCPDCGSTNNDVDTGSTWRWNGEKWEHRCRDVHPQVGHWEIGNQDDGGIPTEEDMRQYKPGAGR